MTTPCNVCGTPIPSPAFASTAKNSLTSLCEIRSGRVEVFFCDRCGHLQTTPIEDVEAYYDTQYNIQTESREQDDLYKIVDGQAVYRAEHQVKTLLAKIALPSEARILDYGCGKSATLRQLAGSRKDLRLHVFDVSDAYVGFWREFLSEGRWATHSPNPAWRESFDVVTSFFSLEHVARPREMAATIHGLLRPGGLLYCLVPNVYRNPADFVVIDHVNHFSEPSLRHLCESSGFEVLDVDADSHDSAFVVVARKKATPFDATVSAEERIAPLRRRVEELSVYWTEIAEKVRRFEDAHAESPKAAIYGAGFHGLFIATCLQRPERVKCFVDQNAFHHGSLRHGKPVVSPADLDSDLDLLYVGLNPAIARNAMTETFGPNRFTYFYL